MPLTQTVKVISSCFPCIMYHIYFPIGTKPMVVFTLEYRFLANTIHFLSQQPNPDFHYNIVNKSLVQVQQTFRLIPTFTNLITVSFMTFLIFSSSKDSNSLTCLKILHQITCMTAIFL